MKTKLNANLVYDLARKVAEASNVFDSDDEDKYFDHDPELWVVGFLLAALERLGKERCSVLGSAVCEASYENIQEEAWKLLKRKGRFEPVIKEISRP